MKHIGKTLAWWYWFATIGLFGTTLLAPSRNAFAATLALTALQAVHFRLKTGDWRALPVQVRLAFLAVLAVGSWGPVACIHWMQLGGTVVRVVLDYCVLARTLSLMPWNRSAPLDAALLRSAYLTPPSRWRFVPPVRDQGVAKGTEARVRA